MTIGTILAMAAMTLTGLLGLFLASRAVDPGIHLFGFVLFALAIFLNFWFIKRHYDHVPDSR
jgi:hypothetical protein